MRLALLLGFVALALAACTQAAPAPSPTPSPTSTSTPQPTVSPSPTASPEESDAWLGKPFSLVAGDSALLASQGIRVHVLDVHGGDDDVTVSVTRNGEEIGQYALKQDGPDTADLGGVSLKLLSVQAPWGVALTQDDVDNRHTVRLVVQAGQQVVDANNRFAFDLLAELREQEGDDNLFISPLSIAMALAMTYNGAAGETERAMVEALRLAGTDRDTVNQGNAALLGAMAGREPDLELGVANSIWAREGRPFHQSFFDRVSRHYGAQAESLPFDDSAKARINGWVEEQTKGKIDSILDEIRPDDVMYLINAIYFKASWLYPFREADTEDGPFRNADGSEVQVPLMHQSWAKYEYLDGDGFAALRLRYNGNASMYFFLPDRDSSLPGFLNGVDADAWAEWMGSFREGGTDGIAIPRFELEYDATLNDVLKAMGMEVAFGGGADFSEMGPGELYIDRVVHKAVVEVHEKGTEAAAATMVAIAESGSVFTFEFIVDRPFFFAITDDQTGSVLFMGAVHELGA